MSATDAPTAWQVWRTDLDGLYVIVAVREDGIWCKRSLGRKPEQRCGSSFQVHPAHFRHWDLVTPAPMREVPVPTRGSGPVTCSEPTCRGHRKRCLFGRQHVWVTWYEDAKLQRTRGTFHCYDCGGVCIAEEGAW